MGLFERYLTVWVGLGILAGVGLGLVVQGAFQVIAAIEWAHVNLVVAVFIWVMIYPMMIQIDWSAVKDVGLRPGGRGAWHDRSGRAAATRPGAVRRVRPAAQLWARRSHAGALRQEYDSAPCPAAPPSRGADPSKEKSVTSPRKILIMGASYGSLLATKLVLAGHAARLICLPAEAQLINAEGAIVRMPVRGREGLVEINSRRLPGSLTASGPAGVVPGDYDLVALAMQEPQYRTPGARELLDLVARSGVPCMSIMNMPPLPYLARIAGMPLAALRACYTDAGVWDAFDPALLTLCSPDPQAFRPPEDGVNVLQVRLATNFKAARFDAEAHTALLRQFEADVAAARFDTGSERLELPVKLKVYDSIFVPLAKWSMLLAGNYRCVQKEGMRSIREAVHGDLAAARAIYDWVGELCIALGAGERDMVPFDKYANSALSLLTPSSAARALANGAQHIERVDLLVQAIAAHKGMRLAAIDQTVALVDGWIEANRRKARAQ